jgi:RNA polymerase sigma-70 factor, ECF subfamily
MPKDFSTAEFTQQPRVAIEPLRLAASVYQELRRIAQIHFAGERSEHTLQRTALVNEAYLRLAQSTHDTPTDKTSFVRLASHVMRNILVDHARAKSAEKRGGDVEILSLDRTIAHYGTQCLADLVAAPEQDENTKSAFEREIDFVALDRAIEKLTQLSARQAQVVELKFFGEQSIDEIAVTLDVSTATIKRDWAVARLFLLRELSEPNFDE